MIEKLWIRNFSDLVRGKVDFVQIFKFMQLCSKLFVRELLFRINQSLLLERSHLRLHQDAVNTTDALLRVSLAGAAAGALEETTVLKTSVINRATSL